MSTSHAVERRVSASARRAAARRAEMYRRFLPEWPALAESFEREARAIGAALRRAKS